MAIPVLETALASYDDTHARDKALYLLALARAYSDAGEREQATATVARARELADGIASVRPAIHAQDVEAVLSASH